MDDPDRLQLLFGPYQAPRLKPNERVYCLYKDCLVVVRDWSDAPIPWPRCRRLDSLGSLGVLVDEELARDERQL